MSLPESSPLVFATLDHRASLGRVFGIRRTDLARHIWVLGASGSGKSALLERLAVQEIERGHGLAVIDPHGDLANALLTHVPRHRTNDVIVLDPTDRDAPVGLNLLERVPPEGRALVVSAILGIFRRLFGDGFGPRSEHLLRNALLALLEVRGTTLLGIIRLLVDASYRASVVRQVKDPLVRLYFEQEFEALPQAFRAEVTAPVLNKLGALLSSPTTRILVGQRTSAIDFRTVMDEGHILIARLSKGEIGMLESALLGAILTTKFQLAAYARADVAPEARRPFTLYADEFGSYVTPSFAELLSEARKYGLSLVLANQYTAQLDPTLLQAVQTNAATKIVFRLGADDAEKFGREFAPELSALDLMRLARHQITVRLCVDGMTSAPFTSTTIPPLLAPADNRADVVRRASRDRYGRARDAVERQVAEQLGAQALP